MRSSWSRRNKKKGRRSGGTCLGTIPVFGALDRARFRATGVADRLRIKGNNPIRTSANDRRRTTDARRCRSVNVGCERAMDELNA